jgi:Protein of unknown function (DUF3352)
VAVGRGAAKFWWSLSIYTRRRFVFAVGVAAVIALIVLVAVPALPCQAPGGDVCPPSDDAVHLAPGDSLAYLHVNVDSDTDQFKAADALAARLPSLTQQVVGRLLSQIPGPGGNPPDFAHDVAPWFGGEAAIALIPAGAGAAEEVQLLEVSDPAGAQGYANSISSGKPQKTRYRNVEVQTDRRGLATAEVGGFLAIGRASGIRDVIDAHSGAKGTSSLADDPAASAARSALPDERLADAYLSAGGIARLVASPRGPLSTFASVVSPGASRGVAAALVASDDGLDVDVRSELDAEKAKANPGFFSAFPSFEPSLSGSLPADSLGYVGVGDPGTTLRSLLEQASTQEPGLAAAVGALFKQVKNLGGVNLEADLLPSLGGEAAFALEPSPGAGGGANQATPPSAGSLVGSQTPFLLFLGKGIDETRASKALAGLEDPLAKALGSASQAPTFRKHKVGGVAAHSLPLSNTVDLTYAIVDSALVIATDPAGVEQVASGGDRLGDADLYRQATGGLPGSVSLLGYVNLQDVVSLAERAGLAQDPAYTTFAAEIRKLEALGLGVQSSESQLATDLRLVIGEGTSSAAGAPLPGAAPTG